MNTTTSTVPSINRRGGVAIASIAGSFCGAKGPRDPGPSSDAIVLGAVKGRLRSKALDRALRAMA